MKTKSRLPPQPLWTKAFSMLRKFQKKLRLLTAKKLPQLSKIFSSRLKLIVFDWKRFLASDRVSLVQELALNSFRQLKTFAIFLKKYFLTRVSQFVTNFRTASLRTKVRLLILPVFLCLLALFTWQSSSLFTPPKVVVTFPDSQSRDVSVATKVTIQFDRPMLSQHFGTPLKFGKTTASELTPVQFSSDEKPDSVSWQGSNTLSFTPASPLERNTEYILKVDRGLFSSYFVPLWQAQTVKFTTEGDPKILLASPQGEILEKKPIITIMFDRPMVPVTLEGKEADDSSDMLKSPLIFIPLVPGSGRWLGSSAYEWTPDKNLAPATTFQYGVAPGLKAQDGSQMLQSHSFSFETESPHVALPVCTGSQMECESFESQNANTVTVPASGEKYANIATPIVVNLNLPVTLESAQSSVKLFAERGATTLRDVPATIQVHKKQIILTPNQPLERELSYRIQISPGLKTLGGPNQSKDSYSFYFKTAPLPKVLSSDPSDGTKNSDETSQLKVKFNAPMKQSSFNGRLHIDPLPKGDLDLYFSNYSDNNTLSINSSFERSTSYKVTLDPEVVDQHGTPLGKSFQFSFETAPYDSTVVIEPSGTYFATFSQSLGPKFLVRSRNTSSVSVDVFKIDRSSFLELYRARQNYQESEEFRSWQYFSTQKLSKLNSWQIPIESPLNVSKKMVLELKDDKGQKLPAGMYLLDLSVPKGKRRDRTVVIISDSATTFKISPQDMLIWAVNQSNGQPISKQNIEITDKVGESQGLGQTNSDGVWQLHDSMPYSRLLEKNKGQLVLFAFLKEGDNETVVASDWSSGLDGSDFGLNSSYYPTKTNDKQNEVYLLIDRPIYRPGQKVYYKGVVRRRQDNNYTLPTPNSPLQLTVHDSQNKEIYATTVTTSSAGSFAGEFSLGQSGKVGEHSLVVKMGETQASQDFQVEMFRTPEFAVKILTPQQLLIDELIKPTISASYYFGAPLPRAKVSWSLTGQDAPYTWSKDRNFEFGDADSDWYTPWWSRENTSYFGQELGKGKGLTDKSGELKLSLPILEKKKTNRRLRLEATVEDISHQTSIANSQEFLVYNSSLDVGLKPLTYTSIAGAPAGAEVVTINSATGEEKPALPINIQILRRSWSSIREKNPNDGQLYWISKPIDSFIESQQLMSDQHGRTKVVFTPQEAGTYKVQAEVKDDQGRTAVSSTFIWVTGDNGHFNQANNDRVPLIPDKQEYKVGEKAKIGVAANVQSGIGLVTTERNGVYSYQVLTKPDQLKSFSIDINQELVPNIFVSALFVHPSTDFRAPPDFKMGITEIRVSDPTKHLNVEFLSEKKEYLPGEVLKSKVKVTDQNGAPVQAEVAVAVVDQAVWSLARVELPDIFELFYRPQQYAVSTSHSLTLSMDRINANTLVGAKGGSGGGGCEGGDCGATTMRDNFADTAYWNASLVTNSQGIAEFEVKLPDNLTQWRLSGVAATDSTAVGQGSSSVVVTKPILITPYLPRFVSLGDEATLSASVHNLTSSDQNLSITLELNGGEVVGNSSTSLLLPAHTQKKIVWPSKITTLQTNLEAKITASNQLQVLDSVKVVLPMQLNNQLQQTTTSGTLSGRTIEQIKLPTGAVSELSKLKLTLSSSRVGAAISGVQNYIAEYPFYCTEQTVAKLVIMLGFLELNNQGETYQQGVSISNSPQAVVTDAIERLVATQNPDGGWGWWGSSMSSDPVLSSMATSALWEAKQSSQVVPDVTLDKAATYLSSLLSIYSISSDEQAIVVEALTKLKKVDTATLNRIFEHRREVTLTSRAYLLLAIQRSSGVDQIEKTLLQELLSLAKLSNTSVHWEENSKSSWRLFSNSAGLTALMIEASLNESPDHPYIARAISWLESAKHDGHWSSTHDTRLVAHAVSRVAKLEKAGFSQPSWQAKFLNQNESGQFEHKDIFKNIDLNFSLKDLKSEQSQELSLEKSGWSNLYYNLTADFVFPFAASKPTSNGFTLIRELQTKSGKKLSNTVTTDEEIWVKLTLVSPQERHHVVIEDKLPAGFEPVNESLATTTLDVSPPKLDSALETPDNLTELFADHQEMRSDRTLLFVENLTPGVYYFSYRVRPSIKGKFQYPPAVVSEMYFPDVKAASDGGWIEIK